MMYVVRGLVCLLLIVAGVCTWLIGRQLLRSVPELPQVELADPLVMPELQRLARQAETGQASDWTTLGEALLGQGFYAHAIPVFQQALQMDSSDMRAQFGLAFCLDRIGNLTESSLEYRKVLKLKPTKPAEEMLSVWAFYALGRNALRQEQAEEAEKFFSNQSGYSAADYQTAKLRLRSGRVQESLPVIERGLQELPYSLEFHFLNHRAQQELGQTREAYRSAAMIDRSAYLVSANFNTEYVQPLRSRLGMKPRLEKLDQLLNAGQLDEAAPQLHELLSLIAAQPTGEIHYLNVQSVAMALLRRQPDQVFELLERIRATGREDEVLLEFAGDAWKLKGDLKKAAEYWERALRLVPSLKLHSKLAEYYASSDPQQAAVHRSRIQLITGIEKYRSNQLEAALIPLKEATFLNPADPDPWFYLGEMNFHLERPAAAIAAYQECLQRRPSHGRAASRLQFLNSAPASPGN